MAVKQESIAILSRNGVTHRGCNLPLLLNAQLVEVECVDVGVANEGHTEWLAKHALKLTHGPLAEERLRVGFALGVYEEVVTLMVL